MKNFLCFALFVELINNKKITAKYISEKLEVSTRSVYRLVDELICAGVPISTLKGKNGGIFLEQNFVLNSLALNFSEREQLKSMLSGLSSGNEFIKKLNL